MSPWEDQLRANIRAQLAQSREADPKVIARRMLSKLTSTEREQALQVGLEWLVRNEVSNLPTEASRIARGPSRRSIVARERVYVADAWKLLDDCTHADLLCLAEDYRQRSDEMMARAREAEILAADLARSGYATLGEMRAHAGQRVAA